MRTISRFAFAAVCAVAIASAASGAIAGQRHGAPPRAPAHRGVEVRTHVFIGGYFYDPFFGPYPWWPRGAYPPWYFPVYDRSADLHLHVVPSEAAVYIDGFYAGIVDDFDGIFQALTLPPGGHMVTLYREGLRTAHYNVYLRAGSSFTIHLAMDALPPGVPSEPPPVAAAVPMPPEGTYRLPRTPAPPTAPPASTSGSIHQVTGFGTLDIQVQPASASITVDGQPWATSDEGHVVLHVPAGMHRVVVEKSGYSRFAGDVEVDESNVTPLNVSLMSK